MENSGSKIFDGLNDEQKKAVGCIEGPVLIIAGAGSGKTRVLTNRIAYMVESGIPPETILALTFTKKAAGEMMERIRELIGWKARRIYMGTFHSVFIKFLREYHELIGYPESFTIYDTNDSRNAIKACVKDLQLDDKVYKPADVLSRISMAKNNLITPSAYRNNPQIIQNDFAARRGQICEIYSLYAKRCKVSGVMDFDDILLNMNILLRDNPDVLEALQERFRYILVDEYQDTNYAQYLIIRKLSEKSRNICVVGDDSQSIYAFRGARVENILSFKKDYDDCRMFRLEQNYRSTKNIVNAANSLIEKNKERIEKKCFSQGEDGDKIRIIKAFTDQEEAMLIASSIMTRKASDDAAYKDFAVLYRTNAQSRVLEEALRRRNIPYIIYSGHSFYDREEVKNLLAYFRFIVNPSDNEALRRIINIPARGIGPTSMAMLSAAAADKGISLWDAIVTLDLVSYGLKPAAIKRIGDFVHLMGAFIESAPSSDASAIARSLALASGIYSMYKEDRSMEGQSRLENIDELLNAAEAFVEEETNTRNELYQIEHDGQSPEENPVITMSDFLENISLMSDVDSDGGEDAPKDSVTLMTIHSSKGLEFPYVYVAGMEENLFPSANCMYSERDIEEERRLFYVAMTRAERAVTLSYASSRMKYGQHVSNPPSRFIDEIDPEYISVPSSRLQTSSGPARFHDTAFSGATFHGTTSRDAVSRGTGFQPRPSSSSPAPRKVSDKDFIPDPVMSFSTGMRVEHSRFGFGVIVRMEGSGNDLKAVVRFDNFGEKVLLMKFAKLRRAEEK